MSTLSSFLAPLDFLNAHFCVLWRYPSTITGARCSQKGTASAGMGHSAALEQGRESPYTRWTLA